MCGIIGIANKKDCVKDILLSLTRLEYRGYDSSGIATLEENKFISKINISKIFEFQGSNVLNGGEFYIISYFWAIEMEETWDCKIYWFLSLFYLFSIFP